MFFNLNLVFLADVFACGALLLQPSTEQARPSVLPGTYTLDGSRTWNHAITSRVCYHCATTELVELAPIIKHWV